MALYEPGCHPQNIIWAEGQKQVLTKSGRKHYIDQLANKDKQGIYRHKVQYVLYKYSLPLRSIPYLGLHNAHPLLALKISRKKLVCVYNAHGLLKKIVVRNVRIKYQSYIFFSPLSMFHLLGEFQNHLSLFIFNKVAKY